MSQYNFKIGFLNHIRNNEDLFFYINTVEQLEEVDFKRPMMQEAVAFLRQQVEPLKEAMLRERKHKSTDDLQELHKRRRGMLKSLRDLIDGSHHRETQAQRDAAKVLTRWIADTRDDIKSRNLESEMYAVYVLRNRAADDEAYLDALQELGLHEMFDVLLDLQEEIMLLELGRSADWSEWRSSKNHRRDTYRYLRNMLGLLNTAIMLEGEDSELADEMAMKLDANIISARRLYRFRKSINLNKKEREEMRMLEEQLGYPVEEMEEEDSNGELRIDN